MENEGQMRMNTWEAKAKEMRDNMNKIIEEKSKVMK